MSERVRIALVTGASRGIGRSIAVGLMNDGVKILAVARPSRELESLAVELGDAGETWPIDATGDEFLERVEALDRLDILVNNLGTNRPMPIGQVSDDDLAVMIEMNVRAPFRTCRSAIGRMENGGVIVNISSQMGHVGSPNRSVYCMTKHALEGLTKALAVELAPRNIRVNAVAPTFIETPMTRPMFENSEFAKFVMDRIPLGRLGQVEDVAAAVRYLCSPTASMITGHSLLIDGGWTAQ